LQIAGKRHGVAWKRLVDTLDECRAGIRNSETGLAAETQSRFREAAKDYLAIARATSNLLATAPKEIAAARQSPRRGERRQSRRYPVQMALEYRLLSRGKVIGSGHGRSVNASSNGILFESDFGLPPKKVIQLRLAWPKHPGAAKPLELHVSGRTIRRQDNLTAVAIDRHDFRTLLLPDPADRASSASTTE